LRLLGKFLDESPALVVQAQQALAQGDRETATQRLHNLKGNAGSIGAMAIMTLVNRLEQAIDEGETAITNNGDSLTIAAGLAALVGQLAALATASAPWLSPDPVTPLTQGGEPAARSGSDQREIAP